MSRSAQLVLLLLLGPAVSALWAEEATGEPVEVPEPETVETTPDEAVEAAEDEEADGALPTEAAVEPPGPWRPDPVEALWRSGVIAGWGQFYNEQYLKGAILFGLEALAVYGIWYYADAAAAERRRFEALDVPQRRTSPDLADIVARREYHWNLYESYRVNYETHIWLTVLVVVYSMLDAYVDAHLADFETGEELVFSGAGGPSLDFAPYIISGPDGNLGAGVVLSLGF